MTQFHLVERHRTGWKTFWRRGLGSWRGAGKGLRSRGLVGLRGVIPAALALLLLLPGVLLLPGAARAGAGHVVLVVIDGPRHTEFLDEPGMPRAQVLGTQLAPAGARITDYQNQNQTVTMVGHGTLVTGTEQALPNDGSQRPNRPTLFELIRKERGLPQTAVRLVAGKDKIGAVSYSTDPAYGSPYGATVDAVFRQDPATYAAAVSAITADPRPVFTMINFASVDYAGHAAVWANYLAALAQADSLVGELWAVIQADSVLGGDTDLFVVADHGRHDDAHGGFANHGDGCVGCRALPFVAIGPDIRTGVVSGQARVQEDVAPTIAAILGLTAPPMEGWVMEEILVSGQVGVGDDVRPRPVLRARPNPFRGEVTVEGDLFGSREAPSSVAGGAGAGSVSRGMSGGVGAGLGSGEAPGEDGRGFDGGTESLLDILSVDVFRVDGRRVLSPRPVDVWPWRWNGRDDAGRAVPAGVYWIRVRSPEGDSDSVRAVKVR